LRLPPVSLLPSAWPLSGSLNGFTRTGGVTGIAKAGRAFSSRVESWTRPPGPAESRYACPSSRFFPEGEREVAKHGWVAAASGVFGACRWFRPSPSARPAQSLRPCRCHPSSVVWVASSSGVFGAWRWRIARAPDHRQGLPALPLPPVFGTLRSPCFFPPFGWIPARACFTIPAFGARGRLSNRNRDRQVRCI